MFKKKQTPARRSPDIQRPSNNVFSYHSKRSGADMGRARYEPPVTQARGFKRLAHLPTVIAFITIIGSLGYASVLDSSPRIMIMASETGKSLERSESQYEAVVSKELSKSSLNKSKFTFNGEKLAISLQKEFPEIANVVVSVPLLGHKPIVKIAVASPVFILASQNGAYFISEKGVPLVRINDVQTPPTDIVSISDESNLPITAGTQVLPSDTVTFITELLQQLQATDTLVASVVLPQAANELQVRIQGKPYAIRFNTLADARIQVGTAQAVIKRLEGSREAPKEYIDVRVEERAYYK